MHDRQQSRDTSLLEIRDVKKQFGGIRALDGCTFTVCSNSITGLIGPNGAGKTTLFDVITGLQTADAGEISLGGMPIRNFPPHRIAFHESFDR